MAMRAWVGSPIGNEPFGPAFGPGTFDGPTFAFLAMSVFLCLDGRASIIIPRYWVVVKVESRKVALHQLHVSGRPIDRARRPSAGVRLLVYRSVGDHLPSPLARGVRTR